MVVKDTVCEHNKCNGCMVCLDKCPKGCISIVDSIESYNATIDHSICVNCGQCVKVCPNNNSPEMLKPLLWKQGWALENIRKKSSSGGVASAIIYSFINRGGYVASCLFRNGKFEFEITNDLDEAEKFAGSKYVKSNPIGIYTKINGILKTNRVLFIGLPCQVAALKNYIKNDENLYTIDLICHGTPSPKLLEKCLSEYGYELDRLKNIKFRSKGTFGIGLNNRKIELMHGIDEYSCAFLASIDYTDNCYTCQFACLERCSDLTLGDSWGTELIEEEDRGVSLVLAQSNKGKELVSHAELVLKDVDFNNAINRNHQLSHPSPLTPQRHTFFKLIRCGFSLRLSTFIVLPRMVLKQKIKHVLIKLRLRKNRGGGYRLTIIK